MEWFFNDLTSPNRFEKAVEAFLQNFIAKVFIVKIRLSQPVQTAAVLSIKLPESLVVASEDSFN